MEVRMNAQDWVAYVEICARLHGLTLTPARTARVAEQLQRTAALAGALADFPLRVEDEPAALFCPAPFPAVMPDESSC